MKPIPCNFNAASKYPISSTSETTNKIGCGGFAFLDSITDLTIKLTLSSNVNAKVASFFSTPIGSLAPFTFLLPKKL